MSLDNHDNMSFLEHLEELRWHIIRSLLAIVCAGFVCFLFPKIIYDDILLGPFNLNFPTYQFLCKAISYLGMETNFCSTGFDNFEIINRKLTGQFTTHISSSIYAGIILSFPYVIFEIWKFIAPGLLPNEKNKSSLLIFSSSFLFLIGVVFGYFVLAPLSLNFLLNYVLSGSISNEIDLTNIVSASMSMPIVSGIAFQLPIIVYFLSKAGIVSPNSLIKYRKYAIIIILIISALATPPDIFSQIILSVPVLILYQIGIFISKIVVKNQSE